MSDDNIPIAEPITSVNAEIIGENAEGQVPLTVASSVNNEHHVPFYEKMRNEMISERKYPQIFYKNNYNNELNYNLFYFPTVILLILVTLAIIILPIIFKNTNYRKFWKNKNKSQLEYILYDESAYYRDGKKITVLKHNTKKAYPVSSYGPFLPFIILFQIVLIIAIFNQYNSMYNLQYSDILLIEIIVCMFAYGLFEVPYNAIYYKDIHKDENGNIIKTKYSTGYSAAFMIQLYLLGG